MKWMVTEDKLGPEQIEVIGEIGKSDHKPIWIKGHAGSGKSVLLLHALSDFLAKKPGSSVCVVVFTNALVDLLRTGILQIPLLAGRSVPVYTIYEFRKRAATGIHYDAIFCDEVQDLPKSFINTLKRATKLIVAGDASQSIYNSVPNFDESPAKPAEIKETLQPLEKELTVIYRLSKSVLEILKKVFPEMLSSKVHINKADTVIDVFRFSVDDAEEEISFVWERAKETNALRSSEVSAILLNSHENILMFCNKVLEFEGYEAWGKSDDAFGRPDYNALNRYFNNCNIPLMYVGNSYGSLQSADISNKIVIMTYHSAKGLDFDSVYLPLANDDMYFHSKAKELILVALSRSKNDLVISYAGEPHPTLNRFINGVPIKSPTLGTSDELDF